MSKITIGKPDGLFFVFGAGKFPVTNMFDIDGIETDDLQMATSAVVAISDDRWVVVQVRDSNVQRLQLN